MSTVVAGFTLMELDLYPTFTEQCVLSYPETMKLCAWSKDLLSQRATSPWSFATKTEPWNQQVGTCSQWNI